MPVVTVRARGITLERLVFKVAGGLVPGLVERTLEANPDLAQASDEHAVGTRIVIPEVGELEVRARRIAAQMRVPVAFASAAGDTGSIYPDAAGCSAIWDQDGTCVAACDGSPGAAAHAVLVP